MSDALAPAAPQVPAPPRENLARGALAALLTVPVGVAVWVVVWGFGFVASIVAAGVAFLALRLYLWGAGRITRTGAAIVLVTTTVTLLVAFWAGIVYDAAVGFGEMSGLGAWGAFTHPEFWPAFGAVLPEAVPDYLPDFGFALLFGALGSFATLRGAFAAADQPGVVTYVGAPADDDAAPAPDDAPAPVDESLPVADPADRKATPDPV